MMPCTAHAPAQNSTPRRSGADSQLLHPAHTPGEAEGLINFQVLTRRFVSRTTWHVFTSHRPRRAEITDLDIEIGVAKIRERRRIEAIAWVGAREPGVLGARSPDAS